VDSAGSACEGDEESVALRIDLDPAVAPESPAHDAAMFGERLRVGFGAELMQEPGRALHVREEEGHGASR
jgi:hypothetical protein